MPPGSNECANAVGHDDVAVQGYNYHAGTDGNGYPNGYSRFYVGAGYNGGAYAESTAGCAAGCDDDMLGFACVTFMYHPGNNCYLFAEGSASGWNAGNGNPWRTFDRCTSSCAAPDGMTGFEYYADDPYGYPNGYTRLMLASNGYSTDRAGCRSACEADELGFDCVVFMSHPGDHCYLFAEGVATGWNDQGHTSADGGWTTYRRCSGSSPPPPCAAGTSGSPGSCADCAAGQHQPSAGQESCTACPAGQSQGSTGQQGCASCAAGQYQGSAGQAGCGAWCHDPPFSMNCPMFPTTLNRPRGILPILVDC